MNANDAAITELATAQSGSTVQDSAPNAPAQSGFDLVVEVVAGSVIGNGGQPYTLQISVIDLTAVNQPWPSIILDQAFNAATGYKLTGAAYQCVQTFPVAVPGGAGGPLSGHILQYTASLVSQGGQTVSIIESDPFVLV